MEYPFISEYCEAILSAEDNFNELSSLRPVLDAKGNPVMSSGNFAVIFKMRDERDGKLYAVKCFTKEQERRNESYRRIADELDSVVAPYVLPLRYLEDELFVDSPQCECEEFPVVLMDWVEGETLSVYIERNIGDRYALEMLSYRFNRMAAWLLTQTFAHGDLKPDNILVREDGSLVLVDYDGMFVPSMKGELAREAGSPDYRHPERTDRDFSERIDDFSIAVISLSLKAIALKPELRNMSTTDTLLFTEGDFRDPSTSATLKEIQTLTANKELSLLLGAFFIVLANNSLDLLSLRTFMTAKPKKPKIIEVEEINTEVNRPLRNSEIDVIEEINTKVTEQDLAEGIKDEFGVIYSKDGKRLLRCSDGLELVDYNIKAGVNIICNSAFSWCKSLRIVTIPDSVRVIGDEAFYVCESLKGVFIPDSVKSLGTGVFSGCKSLRNINIPNSIRFIGEGAFSWCESMYSIDLPDSVTTIGERAFRACKSLRNLILPNSITTISDGLFSFCESLQKVVVPDSVKSIGDRAFWRCKSLRDLTIPNSIVSIGEGAFWGCESLQIVGVPDFLIIDKENVFPLKCKIVRWK